MLLYAIAYAPVCYSVLIYLLQCIYSVSHMLLLPEIDQSICQRYSKHMRPLQMHCSKHEDARGIVVGVRTLDI